jgi:hypothetical protein
MSEVNVLRKPNPQVLIGLTQGKAWETHIFTLISLSLLHSSHPLITHPPFRWSLHIDLFEGSYFADEDGPRQLCVHPVEHNFYLLVISRALKPMIKGMIPQTSTFKMSACYQHCV